MLEEETSRGVSEVADVVCGCKMPVPKLSINRFRSYVCVFSADTEGGFAVFPFAL